MWADSGTGRVPRLPQEKPTALTVSIIHLATRCRRSHRHGRSEGCEVGSTSFTTTVETLYMGPDLACALLRSSQHTSRLAVGSTSRL